MKMNIKLNLRATVLAAMLAIPCAHSVEVSKVRIEDTARVGDADLVLNGAGLRTKGFIEVYIGALYTPTKSSSAAPLLDSTAPRRMLIRMMRDVGSKTMIEALTDGINLNTPDAERAALKAPTDQLTEILKKIGELHKGDQLVLDFTADGVAVTHNGKAVGKVASAAFPRALLRVWIGDKPVDGDLKKSLLGN